MKRIAILFAILAVFLCIGSAWALPTVVPDNYWGGATHGFGDVIAASGDHSFDISQAEINLTGTMLSVAIYTNFAGLGDDGLFSRYTAGNKGIGYGDLFLSSSWDPYGSPQYANDNSVNGTLWTYGLALDNRWWDGSDSTGGTATLFALNGSTNNANALLSDDFMTGATYRNGQEIAVDTSLGSPITEVCAGTWNIDTANQIISFLIDIDGTSLLQGDEIAFHWGMTCGNDVIEGSASSAPVPEPATMFLFGVGLCGLAFVGRKKLNRQG